MSKSNTGGGPGGRAMPPTLTTVMPASNGVQGGYTPTSGSGAPPATPSTGSGGKK